MPIRRNSAFFAILPHIRRDTWIVVAHWPGGYKKQVTGISFWTRQEAWFWIRLEFESWLRRNGGSPMKKRPRDPAQLAKLIVDIATGEVEDRPQTPEERGKDPAAAELGRKGGQARAKAVSAEKRAEIARRAAQERWTKK
jgi:hypothetical protein